jgi:uncharacterized protein (DUF488 family)
MTLFTLGHGTADAETFAARLHAYPGSRRWPWFGAAEMARWLPRHGIDYVPATELGGRREPRPDSPNVALRERAFRGFADYMETEAFHAAFTRLLDEAATVPTALVCSETLWWRCHRRLISDAAVLLGGADVVHLVGTGRQPHRLTEGVRRAGNTLRYDGGEQTLFDDAGG